MGFFDKLFGKGKEAMDTAADTATGAVADVADTANDMAETAGEAMGDVAEKVEEMAETAQDKAKDMMAGNPNT